MTKIPMVVNDKVKIFREIELVFQHLAKVFLVNFVQPMAHTDIKTVGLLIEKDTATRYHGIVMLGIKDGGGVALGFGAVVLLLPVGLVELPDGGTAVDESGLLGIHLLYAEERLVGYVVPEDSELGLPVVEERRHRVDEAAVFLAVGMVDSVVVFGHN